MRLIKYFLMLTFCGVVSNTSGNEKITLLTSVAPPYVYDDGQEGIAVEITKALFERSNIQYQIEPYPLARAIRLTEIKENFCVIPIQRSQERETKFKWVSPILITHSALFSRSDSDIKLQVLSDAEPYLIGVQRGSAVEEYLKSTKVRFNVDVAGSELQNLKKLSRKRVSLWATDALVGPYYAGLESVEIKQQLIYRSTLRALACNINTPDSLINELTENLKSMYQEGFVKDIFTRYITEHGIKQLSDFLN